MSDLSTELLEGNTGNSPLASYPWRDLADDLILWAKKYDETYRAFAFDFLMSLAYIDTIPNLQKHFTAYEDLPAPYSIHMGFINLCAPLYIKNDEWNYQKAAKPQSGAIGKLTSEIILRFIELLFDKFEKVRVIGGVGSADAVLIHEDGRIILCEVKASPLTTFPFLFSPPTIKRTTALSKLSRTQVQRMDSAIYMHCDEPISLGKPKDDLWPFCGAIQYITDPVNERNVASYVKIWKKIRTAYINKDRDSKYYYIANASGHPPKIAKDEYDWPSKESISDSKTSAGMDRTDDIKKGIYQTLKLGIESNREFSQHNIKTALISNLPAYRHGKDYVEPFFDVYWAFEDVFKHESSNRLSCDKSELKRPFDYIIVLEDSFERGELL